MAYLMSSFRRRTYGYRRPGSVSDLDDLYAFEPVRHTRMYDTSYQLESPANRAHYLSGAAVDDCYEIASKSRIRDQALLAAANTAVPYHCEPALRRWTSPAPKAANAFSFRRRSQVQRSPTTQPSDMKELLSVNLSYPSETYTRPSSPTYNVIPNLPFQRKATTRSYLRRHFGPQLQPVIPYYRGLSSAAVSRASTPYRSPMSSGRQTPVLYSDYATQPWTYPATSYYKPRKNRVLASKRRPYWPLHYRRLLRSRHYRDQARAASPAYYRSYPDVDSPASYVPEYRYRSLSPLGSDVGGRVSVDRGYDAEYYMMDRGRLIESPDVSILSYLPSPAIRAVGGSIKSDVMYSKMVASSAILARRAMRRAYSPMRPGTPLYYQTNDYHDVYAPYLAVGSRYINLVKPIGTPTQQRDTYFTRYMDVLRSEREEERRKLDADLSHLSRSRIAHAVAPRARSIERYRSIYAYTSPPRRTLSPPPRTEPKLWASPAPRRNMHRYRHEDLQQRQPRPRGRMRMLRPSSNERRPTKPKGSRKGVKHLQAYIEKLKRKVTCETKSSPRASVISNRVHANQSPQRRSRRAKSELVEPSAVATTSLRASRPPTVYRIDARTDPSDLLYRPASYNRMKGQVREMQDKMDRHRQLLDRYLQPGSYSRDESGSSKLAELHKSQGASDASASGASRYASVGSSYRRTTNEATTSSSGSSADAKPVSDLRKRLRRMVCKSRNDPSYYRD